MEAWPSPFHELILTEALSFVQTIIDMYDYGIPSVRLYHRSREHAVDGNNLPFITVRAGQSFAAIVLVLDRRILGCAKKRKSHGGHFASWFFWTESNLAGDFALPNRSVGLTHVMLKVYSLVVGMFVIRKSFERTNTLGSMVAVSSGTPDRSDNEVDNLNGD